MKQQEKSKEVLDERTKKSLLQIPYFVLTISLIVTVCVTYFYYSSAKAIDAQRFENRANKIKSEIQNHIETYVALLRAGRGFIYASPQINNREFSKFVENFNLRTKYPGVLAIGYSKVFTAAEKDNLIEKLKKEGVTNFTINPDNPRSVYQSIIYIEPLDERNKTALGFDMSTEETRRAAIETARDSGEFAASGRVILIQEKDIDKQAGFLIYIPVYKSRNDPQTVEERQKEIDGYIYSPFRAEDFVKEIIKDGSIDEVSFRVYDNELNENNLLAIGNEAETFDDSVLRKQNEVEFGFRKWVITYEPTIKFQQQSLIWWTPIIFFLGLSISIILFFLSFSQSRTNLNLVKTANELTFAGGLVQNLLEREKLARENAENSGKVKDEFLANVSHELRTPLNVIGGWINILKMDNIDDETKDKAIEIINKNLRQQTNLVEQMLIFSDTDSFAELKNRNLFSFSELIEKCLEEFSGKFWQKSLILNKNIATIEIFGDAEKLKLAVACVLDNAIKFTPNAGTISVDLEKTKDQMILKISDTGEGINTEILPFVFERFQQSDSSTVRKYTGLGLGLAIAKKIVESHQGTIVAESEGLQKGSLFIITLPLPKNVD